MVLQFPKKYQSSLKEIKRIYESVERTHQGCGKLATMEILTDSANKSMLVIATSGTGKSAIMRWLHGIADRDKILLDSITVPGLKYISKKLSGRTLTLLVDDLSKGGTEYSQIMTVCALGELVYSGFVRKYTAQLELVIDGFRGSAIMNAQPLILKRILKASEFETDIRDKVIRYYHVARPIKVVLQPPSDDVKYGYTYYQVKADEKLMKSKLAQEGHDIFRFEFTKARAEEHYLALVKASAVINGRKEVEQADLWLVNELCKCFYIETELFTKEDLEGERKLDVNILPLLSVLATFRSYKVTNLMADFQVKERRIYQILDNNSEWVHIVKNEGNKVLVPTKACRELLTRIGEW